LVYRFSKRIIGKVATLFFIASCLSACGLTDAFFESKRTLSVVIDQQPERYTQDNIATFEITCSEENCRFQCAVELIQDTTLKNEDFIDCPADFSFPNLTDGTYQFRIRASNQFDEISNTATAIWTVDRTAPVIAADELPYLNQASNVALIFFECIDASPCNVECTLGNQEKETCSSPYRVPLSTGEQTLTLQAFDLASNTSTKTVITWDPDTSVPMVEKLRWKFEPSSSIYEQGAVVNTQFTRSSTTTFFFECSEDNCTFECRIDDDDSESCASGFQVFTDFKKAALESNEELFQLSRNFFVRAVDEAGNIGRWERVNWNVDQRPPIAAITDAPAVNTQEQIASFSFTCDETVCAYQCNLDGTGPPESWEWRDCTWPLTIPGNQGNITWLPGKSVLTPGTHIFRVRAMDSAGNRSINVDEHEWTILGEWQQVTTTGENVCAIDSRDHLWCWGANDGVVGNGLRNTQTTPFNVHPNSRWKNVRGRFGTMCGTKFDNSRWCWGRNKYSSGSTSRITGLSVNDVTLLEPYVDLDNRWETWEASVLHSCGFDINGGLYTVGSNSWGGLGLNTDDELPSLSTPREVPPPSGSSRWVSASCGRHNCGITDTGQLACWGLNYSGEIGDGQTGNVRWTPSVIPAAGAPAASGWISVSVGYEHTCAIDDLRRLWCWGSNTTGKLGLAPTTSSAQEPQQIGLSGSKWKQVSASYAHTCGVQDDGTLWCWGKNSEAQLGLGFRSPQEAMTQVGTENDWAEAHLGAISSDTSCALKRDRSLHCWGSNQFGQMADGRGDQSIATKVGDGYQRVSVGGEHSCALKRNGEVSCWGSNRFGQLGAPSIEDFDGEFAATSTPTVILTATNQAWQDIELGQSHSHAINASDQSLFSWGRNEYGQLGLGLTPSGSMNTDTMFQPRRIRTTSSIRWDSIASSPVSSCAIGNRSQIWCWGQVSGGMVGNGSLTHNHNQGAYTYTTSPSNVTGSWRSVSAGYEHVCAISSSGTVSCWGGGNYGQLGIGASSSTAQPIPLEIQSNDRFTNLSAGPYNSCGVTTINQRVCWGSNVWGQFGHSGASRTYYSSPFVLTSTIAMNEVYLAKFEELESYDLPNSCGLSDGVNGGKKLWCWGINDYGELGLDYDDVVEIDPPIAVTQGKIDNQRVQLTADWRNVSVSYSHACAVRSDDSLWCWGSNSHGQLGHSDNYSQLIRTRPYRITRP